MKRGVRKMGLDISVVKTDSITNLEELFAVKHAVEDSFDWHLGSDPTRKLDRFRELREKLGGLVKSDVIGNFKGDDDVKSFLEKIPEYRFNRHLVALCNSIGDFSEGDTHLFLEWDRLPGTDILNSCSWSLRSAIRECALDFTGVRGDEIVELNPDRLKRLVNKWKSKGFKMGLAKWMGYFLPTVGWRITQDAMHELGGFSESCMDIHDLISVRRLVMDMGRKVEPGYRYWLTSSY